MWKRKGKIQSHIILATLPVLEDFDHVPPYTQQNTPLCSSPSCKRGSCAFTHHGSSCVLITASSSLGLRVGFVRSHDPPPSLFPAVMHLWWEATTSWVLGQGLWVPRELRHGVIQTASSWQAGWPQLSVQKEHSTQTGNKWKLKREENKVPSNWCQTPRKLS